MELNNKEVNKKQHYKPSVMIRTYSSSCSGLNRRLSQVQHELDDDEELARTRRETSTDLFCCKRSPMFKSKSKSILYELNQIKGPSGSIRGHRDVVKTSLENIKVVASSGKRNFTSANLPSFMATSGHYSQNQASNVTLQQIDELSKFEYREKLINDEQDQCVAYTTTLGIIRRTFEDSKQMR